jgi:putative hydrolase of the HAD superfamily
MAEICALFWDVGGVLLTNAWDHGERVRAFEQFHLDKNQFEDRHKAVVGDFENGKLSLDQYLERTVFYQPRSFSPQDFQNFMFSLSQPKPRSLAFAQRLAKKYFMGTINNESRELNQHRIETFQLTEIFDLFLTSCFVGLRKPDPKIYRLALDLTQHAAEQCCFMDDRPENIEAAERVGLHTVLVKDVQQLQAELSQLGVHP